MKAPDWRSRTSNPNTTPAASRKGGTPQRPGKTSFRTVATKPADNGSCNLGVYNGRRVGHKGR